MEEPKPLHNAKYLKQARRDLRNNGTAAEAMLWSYLRRSQLEGRKFRRQHSIDNYIVDFYCPSEKLVIELDGNLHLGAPESQRDFERDRKLAEYGIQVLRFENKEVFKATESVLEYISSHFEQGLGS